MKLEGYVPGLDVTTSSVIPCSAGSCSALTTAKPNNGSMINWQKQPVKMALWLPTCCFRHSMSTVADIPNTSANSSRLPASAIQSTMLNSEQFDRNVTAERKLGFLAPERIHADHDQIIPQHRAASKVSKSVFHSALYRLISFNRSWQWRGRKLVDLLYSYA